MTKSLKKVKGGWLWDSATITLYTDRALVQQNRYSVTKMLKPTKINCFPYLCIYTVNKSDYESGSQPLINILNETLENQQSDLSYSYETGKNKTDWRPIVYSEYNSVKNMIALIVKGISEISKKYGQVQINENGKLFANQPDDVVFIVNPHFSIKYIISEFKNLSPTREQSSEQLIKQELEQTMDTDQINTLNALFGNESTIESIPANEEVPVQQEPANEEEPVEPIEPVKPEEVPVQIGGGSSKKIMYNKRKYTVRKDGRKHYILSKGAKIYIADIKGRYKKC